MVNSRCGLPFQVFLVDLLRGPVLKSGVPALGIVPEFDIPHNVPACVLPGRILGTVNALVLKCCEERFCHRIVVADTGAAGRLPQVMPLQRPGKLTGSVIAAAIGVENRTVSEKMITGGHLDRFLDERRLVIIISRPADHSLRVAIDNRRQQCR